MSLLLNNVRVITLALELKGVRGNGLGEVVAKRTRALTNAANLEFTTAIPDSCLQNFNPTSTQAPFRTGTCGDLRVVALKTELRELYPNPDQAAPLLQDLTGKMELALLRGSMGDLSEKKLIFQGIDVYGGFMLWGISSCINGAGRLFFPHDSLHCLDWTENGTPVSSQIKRAGRVSGFLAGLAADVTAFQSERHLNRFIPLYQQELFAARERLHIINGKNHPTTGPDFDPEIEEKKTYDPLLAGHIKAYIKVLYDKEQTRQVFLGFKEKLDYDTWNPLYAKSYLLTAPLKYSMVCSALEKIGCSTINTIGHMQAGQEVFVFPSFYDVQAFIFLLNEIVYRDSIFSFRLPTTKEISDNDRGSYGNKLFGPMWVEDGSFYVTRNTTSGSKKEAFAFAKKNGAALILVKEPREKKVLISPPPSAPFPDPQMPPFLEGSEFFVG